MMMIMMMMMMMMMIIVINNKRFLDYISHNPPQEVRHMLTRNIMAAQ